MEHLRYFRFIQYVLIQVIVFNMEKITKKEFVRLITSNKSSQLYAGLKKKSIAEYMAISRTIDEFYNVRTATARGYHIVFSNDSHLDLTNYTNDEFHVTEIYKDENILLIYNLHKAGDNSNFDTETILIYAIC